MSTVPFEIDEPADLYDAIKALRAQHVEPPFLFVFESLAEITELLDACADEDRSRFLGGDIHLIYHEEGRKLLYPSGIPFEINGHFPTRVKQ